MVTVPGNACFASVWICAVAWLRETPGFKLNEIVVAGSSPKWLTCIAPTVRENLATALSGTNRAFAEVT